MNIQILIKFCDSMSILNKLNIFKNAKKTEGEVNVNVKECQHSYSDLVRVLYYDDDFSSIYSLYRSHNVVSLCRCGNIIFGNEIANEYVVKHAIDKILFSRSTIEDIAILMGIPVSYKLESYNSTCLDGFAVTFRNETGDMMGICAVDGTIVPNKWIFQKDELSLEDFIKETNTEKRLRFISIIGREKFEKMLKDKCTLVNESIIGKANAKLMSVQILGVLVKMVVILNTFDTKHYTIFVPPWIKTAKDGIAWSFYQDPSTYNPMLEC